MATEELVSILTDYADGNRSLSYEELDQLLDQGADPNGLPHTDSPLMLAILSNDFSLISYLVEKGVDVNSIGGDSGITPFTTPLLFAIGSDDFPEVDNREAIVALLLEFGADPNLTVDDQPSPLVQAIHSKSDYIVDLLLEFDADPTQDSTIKGVTLRPIDWAILFYLLDLDGPSHSYYHVERMVYSLRVKGSAAPSIEDIQYAYHIFQPRALGLPLLFLEHADELMK